MFPEKIIKETSVSSVIPVLVGQTPSWESRNVSARQASLSYGEALASHLSPGIKQTKKHALLPENLTSHLEMSTACTVGPLNGFCALPLVQMLP